MENRGVREIKKARGREKEKVDEIDLLEETRVTRIETYVAHFSHAGNIFLVREPNFISLDNRVPISLRSLTKSRRTVSLFFPFSCWKIRDIMIGILIGKKPLPVTRN